MDPITLAIRDMYERYPYPASPEMEIRTGSDVRLLLSYGLLDRPAGRPMHCLDAGCGRGNQVLGAAFTQPDVHFTGIDVNRVNLSDAAAEAEKEGLRNVRFQEVDLMTLEGLDVPDGGFDVIFSSGVLHHLSSPEEGLTHLRRVLAPHGIIGLMVYGTHGRDALYRFVRAVDILIPRDRPIAERLAVARKLASEMPSDAVRFGPCGLFDGIPESEFVDRYLNVNETSYEVGELWGMLERSGLKFLRWCEPEEWSLPSRTPGGQALVQHLTDLQRFQLVEQLQMRHKLDLIVGTRENRLRPLPSADACAGCYFAISPEVSIQTETRNLHRGQRIEGLSYRLRLRPPVSLSGLTASVVVAFKDQTTPFRGRRVMEAVAGLGHPKERWVDVMTELLAREILYCPQPSQLRG
ncbi:MAG TPA: class I SAM-dependent methyltransferase [Vicinamibacterales bacterium]|jgi:SAM-dependent methyltransferase